MVDSMRIVPITIDPMKPYSSVDLNNLENYIHQKLISTQLHKGIGASGTFINYAIWESTSQFKKAVNNTDFQTRLSNYPASTVISPHILVPSLF